MNPLVLFVGAAAGSIAALHLLLKPRAFRYVMIGLGCGVTLGGVAAYVSYLRRRTLPAKFLEVGLTAPPANFSVMSPILYQNMSPDYVERGELALGEEGLTVHPNVFAQIGVVDVNGVRRMWFNSIIDSLRQNRQTLLNESALSNASLEEGTVFCDIGSGVGNVCLQVLAETHCHKTVGVEIIPSRIREAEKASERAKTIYPEIFEKKEALWVKEDLVNCADVLNKEGVNVLFTHSWMFDDKLMTKLTEVITKVPSIECVVTSRKLDEKALGDFPLYLSAKKHYSADWNDEAPFFVYNRVK